MRLKKKKIFYDSKECRISHKKQQQKIFFFIFETNTKIPTIECIKKPKTDKECLFFITKI